MPRPVPGVRRELAQHVVLPLVVGPASGELADQLHERAAQPLPQVERAEGRQREHREAVGRAEMPRHRPPADLQREVCHDHAEVPVALEQLAPAGGEDLRQRRWRNDEAVDLELGVQSTES